MSGHVSDAGDVLAPASPDTMNALAQPHWEDLV
jgi:hypothetical protein